MKKYSFLLKFCMACQLIPWAVTPSVFLTSQLTFFRTTKDCSSQTKPKPFVWFLNPLFPTKELAKASTQVFFFFLFAVLVPVLFSIFFLITINLSFPDRNEFSRESYSREILGMRCFGSRFIHGRF